MSGEGLRNTHASGVIKKSRMKLGNKGRERNGNPGCFLGKNAARKIMKTASGTRRIASEKNAATKVRIIKKTTSVLEQDLPVV